MYSTQGSGVPARAGPRHDGIGNMARKPSDIHSVRQLEKQLDQFARLKMAMPLLRPFLWLAGVDVSKIDGPLNDMARLRREFDALAKMIDRFNKLFAGRGWIAYDWLDAETAKAAIAEAEAGNMEQAEEILARHYSADQVAIQLRMLLGLASFRPRIRLAELALIDYREGRYHACVPVVLALLDGMVNELSNQGFFSQNVDLIAWDSIAACNSGIHDLKTLLFKPRKKTTQEPITLPYRNGILHGMDLGYDNQMVAAKAWAALFATADWARRIEQGKKEAPPSEPKPTWREVAALLQQNDKAKARLEAWKPREPKDLFDPANIGPHSPEAALIDFLNAWKNKKYGVMARRTYPFQDHRTMNALAGEVRGYYKDVRLDSFEIEAVVDTAPAVAEITVRGSGLQYGRPFDASGTFRLVNFDQKQNPVTTGAPDGTWYIMSWNPWQEASSGESAWKP